jgi:hypothetical protein
MNLAQMSTRLQRHYGISTHIGERRIDMLTMASLLPDTGARNIIDDWWYPERRRTMIDSLSSLAQKAMDEALSLSRYRVAVHECSDFLDVLRYSAVESLSQPWRYDVAVTCSSADIACDTLLLKPASFTFRPRCLTAPRRCRSGLWRGGVVSPDIHVK